MAIAEARMAMAMSMPAAATPSRGKRQCGANPIDRPFEPLLACNIRNSTKKRGTKISTPGCVDGTTQKNTYGSGEVVVKLRYLLLAFCSSVIVHPALAQSTDEAPKPAKAAQVPEKEVFSTGVAKGR